MYVGIAALELHLPHCHDLKAKRRVVRSMIERLHARHRISAAETAHENLRQRAEIGIALVARQEAQAQQMLDQVLRLAEEETEVVILAWNPQILEEAP